MYEIPAHNLAAPRPAPIPFPVCAGVHGEADCAPSDADDLSRESHQPDGGAMCASALKDGAE